MALRTATLHVVDTLRLSKREHDGMLAQLGRASTVFAGNETRTNKRNKYEVDPGVVLEIDHPGGSKAALLVKPRNLSSHGIGFVHGAFLYVGSACSILLKRRDGSMVRIGGKVVRCCFLHGRLHEIGVKFEEPLDLAEYIVAASTTAPPPADAK